MSRFTAGSLVPDLANFANGYDVHDNPVTIHDANGTVVTNIYDLLNRLIHRSIAPGLDVSTDTTTEIYKYDGLSRVVHAQDNDTVVTRQYDTLSRVVEETFQIDPVNPLGAVPKSVLSGYDGAGNLVSAQYPGLEQFLMTPDPLNRPRTIRQGGQTLAEYRYVGQNRVERRDLGNGVRTTFAYDAVRRMEESRHQAGLGTGTIVDHRSYGWDEMFNKIQRKDLRAGGPQKVHDYEYDPANRVTKTTVTDPAHPSPLNPLRKTTYLLDGVHNRREVQGSPDPGPYVGWYFQDSTCSISEQSRLIYRSIWIGTGHH